MTPPNPALAAHLLTGWFVACDPGTQYPAIAIFDRGVLTHASRVKVPAVKFRELEEGERVRQIVYLCRDHVVARTPRTPCLAVVHEWPRHLQHGKGSKNSANQLFPLAAIGAGLAIAMGCQAVSPTPDIWIGQVPKDDKNPDCWDSPRGRMIQRRLSAEEIASIVPSHDAVDASGLGLWILSRLDRIYPGTI